MRPKGWAKRNQFEAETVEPADLFVKQRAIISLNAIDGSVMKTEKELPSKETKRRRPVIEPSTDYTDYLNYLRNLWITPL